MRNYAIIHPTFWTGKTGRAMRALGPEAQTIAHFLITGPNANMLGLYELPLATLCHYTGSSFEGALKALRSFSDLGFAHYDETEEMVFLPEMSRFQTGAALAKTDKQVKGIWNVLQKYRKSRFFKEFHRRYQRDYHLPAIDEAEGLGSPFEASSNTLRSQEQDQEQDQEQKQDQNQAPKKEGGREEISSVKEESTRELQEELNTPEFRAAWDRWEKYHQERRKPLAPSTVRSQHAKCVKLGVEKAVAMIDRSITNGWVGLFEDTDRSKNNGNARNRRQHAGSREGLEV